MTPSNHKCPKCHNTDITVILLHNINAGWIQIKSGMPVFNAVSCGDVGGHNWESNIVVRSNSAGSPLRSRAAQYGRKKNKKHCD